MRSRSNTTTVRNTGMTKTTKLKVTDPRLFPSKNVLNEEFRILSKRCYNEVEN